MKRAYVVHTSPAAVALEQPLLASAQPHTAPRSGVMKLLLGGVLLVALSGCVPIGIQGKTIAFDARGAGGTARTTDPAPADDRGVSA